MIHNPNQLSLGEVEDFDNNLLALANLRQELIDNISKRNELASLIEEYQEAIRDCKLEIAELNQKHNKICDRINSLIEQLSVEDRLSLTTPKGQLELFNNNDLQQV